MGSVFGMHNRDNIEVSMVTKFLNALLYTVILKHWSVFFQLFLTTHIHQFVSDFYWSQDSILSFGWLFPQIVNCDIDL
jgi:hypothetical protein